MAFDSVLTPDTPLFRDILTILRREWKIVLLVFIGVTLGTYLGLMLVTEQYEAEARLLVKLGRENAQVPITVDKGGVYATGVQKEEINSYIQLLTSRSLLEAVVDRIGVDRFLFQPEPPETLLEALKYHMKKVARWGKQQVENLLIFANLRKRLSDRDKVIKLVERSFEAARERDSNVIRISIRLPDPLLAQQFLKVLLDEYLKRHVDLRRNVDVGKVFQSETDAYRKQLDRLQQQILAIKQKWNLSSVSTQRTAMINRLEQFRSLIDQRQAELARLRSEEKKLRSVLGKLPRQVVSETIREPNEIYRKIRLQLATRRLERAKLAALYKNGSERLDILDQEIASLESMLRQQPRQDSGEEVLSRNAERIRLEDKLTQNLIDQAGIASELERQRELERKLVKSLAELNEGESRLSLLELEWKVLEQKYMANATRREEARIAEALDMRKVVNVAVLSPPTYSPEPVKPRKGILMVVAMVLGLLLGGAIALVREWGRGIVYEPRDLDEVDGIVVLGEFRLP